MLEGNKGTKTSEWKLSFLLSTKNWHEYRCIAVLYFCGHVRLGCNWTVCKHNLFFVLLRVGPRLVWWMWGLHETAPFWLPAVWCLYVTLAAWFESTRRMKDLISFTRARESPPECVMENVNTHSHTFHARWVQDILHRNLLRCSLWIRCPVHPSFISLLHSEPYCSVTAESNPSSLKMDCPLPWVSPHRVQRWMLMAGQYGQKSSHCVSLHYFIILICINKT